MEFHFIRGKKSKCALELLISGWKKKVVDTESREWFVKNGLRKDVCAWSGMLHLE